MSALLAPVSTGYTLRIYQQHAVDRAVSYLTQPEFRGRNGLIVIPTGAGKSLVIAGIASRLNAPVLVFQPSKEILEQNAEKLRGYGYHPGIWSASLGKKRMGMITLATIGSVVRDAELFKQFKYVLIDEAHLVNAKGGMYRNFLDVLSHARVIGLTATPYRLASTSLGSELRFLTRTRPRIFDDVVYYMNLGPLFRAGFLAPLAYDTRDTFNETQLRLNSTGADYDDASLQRHFRETGFGARVQAKVQHLLANGHKQALVFTRFTKESEDLAAAIPGSAVITAETPADRRAQVLWQFKKGLLRVVANVGVLSVGFDYPELTTVVLARPTMSLALYYQQVGRCIRPHPSKPTAHVIDMVGLKKRFGPIEQLWMQPGGKNGQQWVIVTGEQRDRVLTNVSFGLPRGFASNSSRAAGAATAGGF
ncbi:MAG: DEAD/DEAH box helicase [Acidobacteriota bacterium]|nr:DEAD/DEAH box helicase [Acidobacteriota bacterium]